MLGHFFTQIQAGNKSFRAAVNHPGLTHNLRGNELLTMMAGVSIFSLAGPAGSGTGGDGKHRLRHRGPCAFPVSVDVPGFPDEQPLACRG